MAAPFYVQKIIVCPLLSDASADILLGILRIVFGMPGRSWSNLKSRTADKAVR